MNIIFCDDQLLPAIDRLESLEYGTDEYEHAFVDLCTEVKRLTPNPDAFGVYKGIHPRTTVILCRALMRGEPWKIRYEFYYLVIKRTFKTTLRMIFN